MDEVWDGDWRLSWVRIPVGTYLSESHDTRGAERTLLRQEGSHKNLGPAESFPADGETLRRCDMCYTDSPRSTAVRELSPAQQAQADAILDALSWVNREIVRPIVKDVVAPVIKRKLTGVVKSLQSKTREAGGQARATELAVPTETQLAEPSKKVDAAVEPPGLSMTSAEFRGHLYDALRADALAAELKRMLSNAHVEDDDFPPELQKIIKLVLEGDASLLDEETRGLVVKFLTGGRFADDEYVLPRNEEIKEARRLTDGQT